MKKGGFLRNVLDTIRSNQAGGHTGRGGSGGPGSDRATEFGGQLKPSHFSLAQVARHGFPEHPTALAFDPVQKIAAIGTKSGALRIFGRPGVDVWAQHEPAFAITYIRFIVNQGALITVTSDDSIHLWSLRGPNLKLQFSSSGQGMGSSSSPGAAGGPSPAPAGSSNLSSMSPQSGMSTNTSGLGGGTGASSTSNSLLDKVTDTVTGAVDSASDFLSGGGGGASSSSDLTASPPGATTEPKQIGSRKPEILHTLKFQREHITCLHQTLMSKWLYIGTERGNVHVANVETFELSGYSIAWNKAIELSRKTHPGAIIHISECPQDTNKLLIGYESGCIVLWDLKQRNADGRYYQAENLLWLAWHYEGKQFVAAHGDGSLITWQTRSNAKPASILYPHAKTAPGGADVYGDLGGQQSRPQQPMAMFLGPSFNNELYRPINKVIWNTSKSTNEQFLLFSGGLPYDGFGDRSQQQQQQHQLAQQEPQTMQHHIPGLVSASPPPSRQSVGGASPARFGSSSSQQQQFLKAGSPASPSPMSPSVSHQQQQQHHHQNNQKVLRSTSLTVMLGKSITVLEMDDTIVDFMTICDNSPYENDASDPYAVIVLLSNELILIDLTSSGYPSFDSPYPSASLNESPVTCVQYLADCSSDLIPFLYSTSQNVISRAPKKGFSDKEWPINGGEWGQSLQSYPELVLTGHADGTIKFWDMSGINFDLISKIKTSKLFERPSKPPNAIFIATNQRSSPPGTAHGGGGGLGGGAAAAAAHLKRPASNSTPMAPNVPQGSISPNKSGGPGEDHHYNPQSNPTMPNATIDNISELENQSAAIEENFFAIEKIEFCPTTRHLLVAGAFSHIIQFKLNKKDTHSGGGGGAASELTTILVEPTPAAGGNSQLSEQVAGPNNQPGSSLAGKGASKQHLLFRVKDHQPAGTAGGSSSGGSSSSTGSHRVRLSGFQPELICLTPLLVSPIAAATTTTTTTSHTSDVASGNVDSNITASTASLVYCCQVPPKITALALQETHNILAYAHENGVVLVDIVQKCVIMNAALSDLYGGGGSVMSNNRDISIQPFATSAILQHHYQSTCSPSPLAGSAEFGFNNKHGTDGPGGVANSSGEPGGADNDASMAADSDLSAMFSKTGAPNGQASPSPAQASANSSSSAAANSSRPSSSSSASAVAAASQPGQPVQSRYTTNSMFQRQLSTNALNSSCSSKAAAFNANNNVNGKMSGGSNAPATSGGPATGAAAKTGPRLFQRQMTASQLFGAGSGGGSSASGGQLLDSKQRAAALLASVRADPSLANSAACLAGSNFNNNNGQQPPATTTGGPSRSPRATEVNNEQTGKKATKNKRIISRMLSISAIHTTVGGGGGGGGASSACESSQDDAMQLNESTSGGGGAGGGHNSACSAFDQVANQTGGAAGKRNNELSKDKFDSSFTRSRSSSTSSTTPLNESHLGNPTNNNNSAAASESIQCIAFLDPLSGSSGTSGGGGGGGPNHKSLCSIDAQSPVSGQLALWLGTSTGAVLLVNLTMPDNEDNRVLQLQSINAEPIPQASVKLPGQMLQIMPFTCEARPSSQSSVGGNASQSSSLEGDSHGLQSPGLSSSSTGGASGASQATSSGIGTSASQLSAHDHHSSGMSSFESRTGMFLALVSEKQARVYQIPANWSQQTPATPASDHHAGHQHQHHHQTHQHSTTDPPMGRLLINKSNLFAKCDLSDTSYACRSSHVQMRTPDECCLVSYLATGNIVVHALPRLRPVLMEADFVAYTSARIGQSMRFSRQGHCLYQPSAGEIAKFTVSSQYKALVNEMTGALYVPREMPEVPRANFFKSLFSVSQSARQSDRDELFAESGKPSRAVAKHVGASGSSSTSGGGGGIEKLKGAAVGTMGHDMRVAREGLDERGERLGQIEDQTLNMLNSSESYAQAAHQLAQKFKDKKWYQF